MSFMLVMIKAILYEWTVALCARIEFRESLGRSEPRGDSWWSRQRKETMKTEIRFQNSLPMLLSFFFLFNGSLADQLSQNVLHRSSSNFPTRCSFNHSRKTCHADSLKYPLQQMRRRKGYSVTVFCLIILTILDGTYSRCRRQQLE